MAAAAETVDLRTVTSQVEAHLPAPALGLEAHHQLSDLIGVPWQWGTGPGGFPLPRPPHDRSEDELALPFEDVTQAEYDDLATLVATYRLHAPGASEFLELSDLGSASYDTSQPYQLLSSLRDWRETASGRWAGVLRLRRAGADL